MTQAAPAAGELSPCVKCGIPTKVRAARYSSVRLCGQCQIDGRVVKNALKGQTRKRKIGRLLTRQAHRCYHCGKKFSVQTPYTFDHVQPLARGGRNLMTNLVLSCKRCNNLKGMLTLEEFRQTKQGRERWQCAERLQMPFKFSWEIVS